MGAGRSSVLTLDEPSAPRAGGVDSRPRGATAAPVAGELIRRVAPLLGLALFWYLAWEQPVCWCGADRQKKTEDLSARP